MTCGMAVPCGGAAAPVLQSAASIGWAEAGSLMTRLSPARWLGFPSDFWFSGGFDTGFAVVFGSVAALIGGLQVVGGATVVQRVRKARAVRARALPVRAVVVRHSTERTRDMDGDRRTVVRTTVRYEDSRELTHEVEVQESNLLRDRPVGSEVDVLYDPEDTSVVLHPGGGAELVVGLAGAFFVLVGLAVIGAAGFAALSVLLGGDPSFSDPSFGDPGLPLQP